MGFPDLARFFRRQETERQHAESAYLAAIVDSFDDAVIGVNLAGVVTSWNKSAETIFGYAPEEIIGRPVTLLIPPDRLDEESRIVDRIRRGEKINNLETARRRKNGEDFPVSLTISPIRDPAGGIIGASRIVHDITERKRAQEAILESQQMARGIIDTALDAFVQMDERGRIIEWNRQAEATFGWLREEAIGKPLATLIVPGAQRTDFWRGLGGFSATGQASVAGKRLEKTALTKHGEEIRVELTVTVLRRRSGHVFNAFVRDLTEKIAAEERLRQAQKLEAVGQLTGGIAHDFNNLLTVITGTIEILAEAVSGDPRLAAVARMIDEAAERGTALTQHLLAFARKQPLHPRSTDINALVIDTAKLLRPSLGEQVEIKTALDEDTWPALVDPSQLVTSLLNLAFNARDAMPNGGMLTIETGNVILDETYASAHGGEVSPGPYVMIAMSDTGQGIPASIKDKVFEPFFTTKQVGHGTGLGLSMVYGFVKQSGGHIKIYSEEGHGTAVRIYLPRAGGDFDDWGESTHAAAVPGGSETILVVEDDELVRNYVRAQLEGIGYTTLVAANATEALAILDREAAIDLLFTDVIIPGAMNGRQLADEAVKRRPALKVLFTSGYTENAIVHHGRLDTGALLLAKPYRKSELARMLRTALSSQ